MKIFRNPDACYGCRACQLICGYHKTGTFSPDAASISVSRDYINGDITWNINHTCDDCVNEPFVLCAKYCAYGAISVLS